MDTHLSLLLVKKVTMTQAKVDQADNDGATPFFIANQNGHKDLVSLLLSNGATVDQVEFVLDPLIVITMDIVRIYITSKKGYNDILSLLFSCAKINKVKIVHDDTNSTPLNVVAKLWSKEHSGIVVANINQNDTLVTTQNGHSDTILVLLFNRAKFSQTRNDGATPLFIAAQNRHNDTVSLLLSNGTTIHQADSNGATPLYIASTNGHKDTVSLLLSNGAKINQARNVLDISNNQLRYDGSTPLFIASQKCHKDTVSLLLSYGAKFF
ncbi:ankyrin 2,3/unc44 [Thraustotheca clavata]|uniref:Ankyrin 2,3/unc44 n=1 Tax=Thraustotheca clavata TaxID=74557 RepID=A0A1V9Y7W9_9STRA|nr:ankyrin 2,3/unc44 [Thraustotheca clavata]